MMSEILGDGNSNQEPRQVTDPQDYLDAFMAGEAVVVPEGARLVARFLRVRDGRSEDADRLALDGRKSAFTMGFDCMSAMSGCSIDDALDMVGWTRNYISDLRANRYSVLLLVFVSEHAPLATWPNVLARIASDYPMLARDIELHRGKLTPCLSRRTVSTPKRLNELMRKVGATRTICHSSNI